MARKYNLIHTNKNLGTYFSIPVLILSFISIIVDSTLWFLSVTAGMRIKLSSVYNAFSSVWFLLNCYGKFKLCKWLNMEINVI